MPRKATIQLTATPARGVQSPDLLQGRSGHALDGGRRALLQRRNGLAAGLDVAPVDALGIEEAMRYSRSMTETLVAWLSATDRTDPWRACVELAWEALQAGSVPVGAVVVDAGGGIVSRGRSRAQERGGPAGQLWGTYLAHAEVNALAALRPGDYPGHTLYTSLEPCLFCTAASVLAHVGTVRYAGADPLWSGVERLPALNAHVARCWPQRYGPLDTPLALVGTLLPLAFFLRRNPSSVVAQTHELVMPRLVGLARELLASQQLDELATGSLPRALDALEERLRACRPDGRLTDTAT